MMQHHESLYGTQETELLMQTNVDLKCHLSVVMHACVCCRPASGESGGDPVPRQCPWSSLSCVPGTQHLEWAFYGDRNVSAHSSSSR